MSLHKAIIDVFNNELSEEYSNIHLTNSDVNRIVTNVVQNFSLVNSPKEQVQVQIESYIKRYKQRVGSRGCGCNKK